MLDLSVVLTTRNRSELLGQTLESFTKLDVRHVKWEVVVVDNGSTDSTPRVLQTYASRLPLRTLHEPRAGKNVALNHAIPLLGGATVVFTDDDVVPRPNWLSSLTAAIRRWPVDGVFGGRIVPLFPPGAPEWLRNHRHTDAAFARFTPDQPEGPIRVVPFGPNYALRSHLLAARRFAPHLGPNSDGSILGDETELLTRIVRAGNRVIYVPSAEVGHVVRDEQLTSGWLFRRAHSLGRGQMRLSHTFSAPRHSRPDMYWRLLVSGLRYAAVASLAPRGSRREPLAVDYGTAFHFWRGQLYEQRCITRETSRARAAAAPREDA